MEPKSKNNAVHLSNISNDLYIRANIDKKFSSFTFKKLNERNFMNLNKNKSLTSSISSNILFTNNNTSSNDLLYNKYNLNEKLNEDNNIINFNINKIEKNDNNKCTPNNIFDVSKTNDKYNIKKLVYHKKSMNNFLNINNINKSKIKTNNIINEINDVESDENSKIKKNPVDIIYFSNRDYLIKLKQNEKMNEFKDFTLSEYLKEQIQNINPNKLSHIVINTKINNYLTPEETNVNTLDANKGKTTDKKNIIKKNNIKHKINKNIKNRNNYITYNNYINTSNDIFKDKTYKKKDKNKNIKNQNINKSNKTNNHNIKEKKRNCLMKGFSSTYNDKDKLKLRKSMNSSRKNLSVSSSNESQNKNKKDEMHTNSKNILSLNKRNRLLDYKKYYSYEKYISNINISSSCSRKLSKNKNKIYKYNNISPNKKKEKCLFNVQIDISKLINENSFRKCKPKKHFCFSKSPKKIINNNININNFNRDFLIIPKSKNN